ncbi:MAG: PIN domain-containing protein [Lautropia sp.]|nr:PIN domain-containing protein [Lautropia sp.]
MVGRAESAEGRGRTEKALVTHALTNLTVSPQAAWLAIDRGRVTRVRHQPDLQRVQILPFDDECSRHAASLRAALERPGTPIGPHDILIAATALRNGAALVTTHVSAFRRVPGLSVLDWHDPLG